MKPYLNPVLSLFVTMLLLSCSQTEKKEVASNKKVEEVKSDVFFTANPQAVPAQDVSTLEIGAKAPDFNLPGVDGRFYQLNDFDESEVLVVVFTCNHCPTAQAYENRIKGIVNDYVEKSVQVVAISPNSIRGLLLNELGYSDLGDSFEDMMIRAVDKEFNFPYLYDGDTHKASIKYGPVATPHAYVFDKNRMLTYVGRLDKSEKPGTANAEDLRTAIDAALNGTDLAERTTKTFGCSVKWAWKDEYAKKVNAAWAKEEVTLEEVNSEGLRALMANNSDKLRLVNLWATWCGPCVVEYPDFVDMHRMYRGRDFEFVSVSADRIDSKEKALKFLKKKQSALQNLIFNEGDNYALIEAIDRDWDGALPYTALIEPGGKIAYKKMGSIDPFELKKAIVEHEMIGRFY